MSTVTVGEQNACDATGAADRMVPRVLHTVRWLATAITWAVMGAAIGLILSVAAPPLAGHKSLTVLTGSMRPAIDPGDVVVSKAIAALDARPGDVVTFKEPDGTRLITHRVRGMRAVGANVEVTTQGDANDAAERWTIPADGRIARVAYRVPKLGYGLTLARAPAGRIGFLVIPAVLLCIWELTRIWRPRHEQRTSREIAA